MKSGLNIENLTYYIHLVFKVEEKREAKPIFFFSSKQGSIMYHFYNTQYDVIWYWTQDLLQMLHH